MLMWPVAAVHFFKEALGLRMALHNPSLDPSFCASLGPPCFPLGASLVSLAFPFAVPWASLEVPLPFPWTPPWTSLGQGGGTH